MRNVAFADLNQRSLDWQAGWGGSLEPCVRGMFSAWNGMGPAAQEADPHTHVHSTFCVCLGERA